MSSEPSLPMLERTGTLPGRGAGILGGFAFALAVAVLVAGSSVFVFGVGRTLHTDVLLRLGGLLAAVYLLRRAQAHPGTWPARASQIVEALLVAAGAFFALNQARTALGL